MLSAQLVEEVARQHPTLQSLSLARNALRDVSHLAQLRFLRRVDLSANRLRAVPPLASLEFLDLRANVITSLRGADACTALRCLDVGDNRVALFSELRFLRPLARLEALTLQGNPIARHPTYRREVLSALPQLRCLDEVDVTPAERLAAQLPLTESDGDDDDNDDDDDERLVTTATADAAVSPIASASAQLLTPDSISRQQRPPQCTSPAAAVTTGGNREVEDEAHETSRQQPEDVLRVDVATGAMTPTARSRPPTPQEATAPPAALPELSRRCGTAAATSSRLERPARDDAATHSVASHTQLLQSRVDALESILAIQDGVIQQGLVDVGRARAASVADGTATVEDAAQLYSQLLNTWRAKVVSLMVQMQSVELARSEDVRSVRRRAEELEAARTHLAQECKLWQQKCADAAAQRDLERVHLQESQKQCAAADSKVVSAVRALSAERERLQGVASAVAFFSARDGVMVENMEGLYAMARRLEAFERRLRFLCDRVETASNLIAHREARLRNSEAAIDAERRIWNHRLEQLQDKHTLGDSQAHSFGLSIRESRLRKSGIGMRKFLRSATETALRALFHRLDPYDTGLVKAHAYLEALRADVAVSDAVGGETKHKKLVEHIEAAVRLRSMYGTISGNLTWGELLLFFMPEGSAEGDFIDADVGTENEEGVNDDRKVAHVDVLPPLFDHATKAVHASVVPSHHRLERRALDSMNRDELVQRVLYLQDDCNLLKRRVLDDARELRRRVVSVRNEWEDKTEQLVAKNEDLQRELKKERETTKRLGKELEATERGRGEAVHQLESLRRELLVQQSDFTRAKKEMESRQSENLLREQEIWQKELQDVNFSHSVLKTENQKQELHIRQLERELSKRNDALVAHETQKVAHLEDKVHKRDAEIAKLRRERNTILNTLREHERKLARQSAVVTMSTSSQTDAALTPPVRADVRSVGCQTTSTTRTQHTQSSDMRMSLDEIDNRLAHTRKAVANETSKTEELPQSEIARRLRQLQSLTESLLDD